MTVIIFLIMVSVLIIAHELGHFLAARSFGVRVDEFGLGYPPRAKTLFKWLGTEFTLNWVPFGGFVKIFGENGAETERSSGSFTSKNHGIQALILVAGVLANFVLAWVLITSGFMVGLPASVDSGLPVVGAHTVITEVIPNSPASKAGIISGDAIVSLARGGQEAEDVARSPENASAFIDATGLPVTMTLLRGQQTIIKVVTPNKDLTRKTYTVGMVVDSVGLVKLPLGQSIKQGLSSTWDLTVLTTEGLLGFLKNIFIGHADFSQVSGPVGLIGLVGQANTLGFIYLLYFTALISINLAVLNLLPIPALDGGRLLFVIIESVIRRPVPIKVFNILNNLGYALLLILMVIITVRDIWHLL